MLYTTTRNQNDTFTAYKVIHTDCAPDGGLFVPLRFPQMEKQQILALKNKSFGQNVADILNLFFSSGLTGWDVEFAIGRTPVKLSDIKPRVTVAQCWHNRGGHYQHLVQTLSDKLRKEDLGKAPCGWVETAIGIAVVFGVFGECLKSDDSILDGPVDISLASGSFRLPMAVWYARQMGLPIGNIVCGCNLNSGVWDLVHHGELSTSDTAVKTLAPEGDLALPRDLERLIAATLGCEEVARYLDICSTGGLYTLEEEKLEKLRKGIFAAVISDSRIVTLIPSVYRISQYIFGPYGALAYGSLMDYRAKTGESRRAILLSQQGPLLDGDLICQCLNISGAELQKLLLKM